MLDAPGIEVGEHPGAAELAGHHHHRKRGHHHQRHEEKHARVHATQKQDAHGDHHHHHERAHVRLSQQQHAQHADGHHHRPHGAKKSLLHLHLAHHVVGGVEQHRQLDQLGWLKIHHTQRNPAPRAVHLTPQLRNQHQHQQQQGHDEQPGCQLLPGADRQLKSHQRRQQANRHEKRMAGHEMGRRVVAKTRVVGQGDGGRIHHHQPPSQQRDHHPQQRLIETQLAHRRAACDAVPPARQTHRQTIASGIGQGFAPTRQGGLQGCDHAVPSNTMPRSSARARTAATNTVAR